MFKIPDGRKRFWQWDQGQRLSCDGLEAGVEVHFAHHNAVAGALVLETYQEDGTVYVDVPDELLRVGGKMTVYVYLEHGSEGHTAYRQSFTVQARQKPEDYVYTPSEVKRWDELDARVAALEQGGGGSVQANWSQNDESAADYVKDRTHYTEEQQKEILPETAYETAYDSNVQLQLTQLTLYDCLESGKTYVVNFNGVEYVCTAFPLDDAMVFIGNGVMGDVGDDTGEPFLFANYASSLLCDFAVNNAEQDNTTGTVSITKIEEVVHQLDEKYIPELKVSYDDLEDKPFYEEVEVTDTLVGSRTETFPIRYTKLNDKFFSFFSSGVSYRVTFDDKEYFCVCTRFGYTYFIGNKALLDGVYAEGGIGELTDTGEPFCILHHDYNDLFTAMYATNEGTHTITIEETAKVVHQLDEKYIPDAILRITALESAVDDALAQAKESGEFDGPAGKDGVIALTGAAVGQIARITAVDDDGVPTAWEPVDMPSGGSEEWELLQSASDVELREVVQTHDGTYRRYVVLLGGVSAASASTWTLKRISTNTGARISTYLTMSIPTHVYGGASFFHIELPENGPAIFMVSESTAGGNGKGTLSQAYNGELSASDVAGFALTPNDSSLEYSALFVYVWGCKA